MEPQIKIVPVPVAHPYTPAYLKHCLSNLAARLYSQKVTFNALEDSLSSGGWASAGASDSVIAASERLFRCISCAESLRGKADDGGSRNAICRAMDSLYQGLKSIKAGIAGVEDSRVAGLVDELDGISEYANCHVRDVVLTLDERPSAGVEEMKNKVKSEVIDITSDCDDEVIFDLSLDRVAIVKSEQIEKTLIEKPAAEQVPVNTLYNLPEQIEKATDEKPAAKKVPVNTLSVSIDELKQINPIQNASQARHEESKDKTGAHERSSDDPTAQSHSSDKNGMTTFPIWSKSAYINKWRVASCSALLDLSNESDSGVDISGPSGAGTSSFQTPRLLLQRAAVKNRDHSLTISSRSADDFATRTLSSDRVMKTSGLLKTSTILVCENCNATKKPEHSLTPTKCQNCNGQMRYCCLNCNNLLTSSRVTTYNHIRFRCGQPVVYHCEDCDYCSKSKYHLRGHILNKHNVEQDENGLIECATCSVRLKGWRNLLQHQRRCGLSPFLKCDFCNYKTKCRFSLKSHLKFRHTNLTAEEVRKIITGAHEIEHQLKARKKTKVNEQKKMWQRQKTSRPGRAFLSQKTDKSL